MEIYVALALMSIGWAILKFGNPERMTKEFRTKLHNKAFFVSTEGKIYDQIVVPRRLVMATKRHLKSVGLKIGHTMRVTNAKHIHTITFTNDKNPNTLELSYCSGPKIFDLDKEVYTHDQERIENLVQKAKIQSRRLF